MKIKGLEFIKTCDACPEQYDVYLGEIKVGYVRLRFGTLRADFPDCGGATIYMEDIGDEWTGVFPSEVVRRNHLEKIADKILAIIRRVIEEVEV